MELILAIFAAGLTILFFVTMSIAIFVSILISLGLFVLWIVTLVDCIKRKEKDFSVGGPNAKLIWLLILILVNNIGPIVYYFLIMYKKSRSDDT